MIARDCAVAVVLAAAVVLGGCSWFRPSPAPPAATASRGPGPPGPPARIDVTNAWVRPGTQGQAMVPAYLDVRAGAASTLVAVESPVAETVEIREPASGSAGDRTLARLTLPRDASIRLAPGGTYLALIGVRKRFGNGESVPLWLTFEDDRRVQHIVRVDAQVRGLSLRPAPSG